MTLTFLLHHTHENRIGLCAAEDGQGLGEDAIIARMSLDEVIGLYDDIDESFGSCIARRQMVHPADEGEE